MNRPIPQVSNIKQYLGADGRLTPDGLIFFQNIEEVLRELRAAQEDHETRITALEP